MGKSLRHISDFDSDSNVSDDLSFESISLRVAELENALCYQDKLLCKVFRENKKLNLELENSFSEIASLWSVHDDMSAKPHDNCKMIMVNISSLLGACTSFPLLKSDFEASAVEIKELKHKLNHSSRYNVLSPPCEMCGSLKGKLFHATKENTELK
jgi:hypothetical protein